jgi:thiol-disulfide isomerase/thioredoxin
MQKALVGFVVAGVVLVGGWFLLSSNNDEAAKMSAEKAAMEEKAMMEKEEMEKAAMEEKAMMDKDESGAMMKKEDQAIAGDEAMMKKVGTYAQYDESKLAMANRGEVVLFFKASWCPSCRALDSNIKANLEAIPAGLTILEVDYDSATALKQKYGVTTQHTLVQVDASGNLIEKWSGSPTLAAVVAKVQ